MDLNELGYLIKDWVANNDFIKNKIDLIYNWF